MISFLIHGFLSVYARLLIAFGTTFYAITEFNTKSLKVLVNTLTSLRKGCFKRIQYTNGFKVPFSLDVNDVKSRNKLAQSDLLLSFTL